MKRYLILILALLFTSTLIAQAQARDKGVDGLLIGAGGGAILGQAFGGDTESTLIGGAVGGALGYIIGNEHDKYQHPVQIEYRHGNQHRRHYPTNQRYQEHRGYRDHRGYHYSPSRHNNRNGWYHGRKGRFCKQTERTITKHGRTKTIVKKVCTENNRHRHNRKASRKHHGKHDDRFFDRPHRSDNSHFVRHRW